MMRGVRCVEPNLSLHRLVGGLIGQLENQTVLEMEMKMEFL